MARGDDTVGKLELGGRKNGISAACA